VVALDPKFLFALWFVLKKLGDKFVQILGFHGGDDDDDDDDLGFGAV
jgi:hypothetical protein